MKIKILDTTLRDGSYAVNFSFTSADTSVICKNLENAGFEYIEIGHGSGLNASSLEYGKTVQTDEEYMIAAEESVTKSKYGMFCIPGIARLEDLDLARKHNMGFIRIGTDVTKVEKSEDFIKKAKKNGMFVAANYMKSYALPPEKFAEKVKLSEKFGADIVYIVDSAGGMFSENVVEYFKAIRKISNIPIGFHGHDNLGLAVSNSLTAAEIGIEFIDSSLQGLGRSSGNACTEMLILALKKKGFKTGIDFHKVLDIGQMYVQPLINAKGKMSLDMISGYADFHSSYMHHIIKYSTKYNVSPINLIIEYSKINKVEMNIVELEKIAQKLKSEGNIYTAKYRFNRYIGREQD
jgi:4-hydroxy-2-oxovalerate aldolase